MSQADAFRSLIDIGLFFVLYLIKSMFTHNIADICMISFKMCFFGGEGGTFKRNGVQSKGNFDR